MTGPCVSVVIPNPKLTGNGRYSYLAAWQYAKTRPGGSDDTAHTFVAKLFANVPALDTGGRPATQATLLNELKSTVFSSGLTFSY